LRLKNRETTLVENRSVVFSALLFFVLCVRALAAVSSLAPPSSLQCNRQAAPLAVSSPQPRLGWMLTARDVHARGVRQSAYRVLVSSTRSLLAANTGDLWDSGKVASDHTLDIPYAGKALLPGQQVFWKVEVWDANDAPSGWSAATSFTAAPAPWAAQWIAAAPEGSTEGEAEGVTHPMPVFRKEFRIHRQVTRALLYVSGLGQDEVHINGAKVGDSELAPGWTDYRKRVLYDTYDVTQLIRPEENVIGVLLGNGMFNVAHTPGRYTKFVGSFGEPRCFVELHLSFDDGNSAVIASGPDWQTADGPIAYSSTYGGEDYDACRVPAAWDAPGSIDAEEWRPAMVVPGPGGELEPENTAPIKVSRVYRPVVRKTLASGATVYDLGQNFAGWPEIAVRGAAGAEVKLICGELLDAEGAVTQRSANAGPGKAQWFSYTLSGQGIEHWHPRFSYYGFRYVQVETSGRAQVLSLAGQAIHSSALPTGEFTSSIPLLNRIHALILQATENNMESVLTDCPQREKLGWLEQSHLMGSAVNFDFDLEQLYAKIEDDMMDAQKADGSVPTIAPQYTTFAAPYGVFNDSPEWGSAVVLDAWLAYRRYGDVDALRAAYPAIRRYLDYLTSRSNNGIVDYGLGDWYDLGPGPPGFSQLTSRALTATAVYYQDVIALDAAARVLGDTEEAARMESLQASVAQAFQQRFYRPEQSDFDRGSQTADAMALALGLVPEAERAAVLARLVGDIRAHNDHTTAGDVGFHYVVDALLDNGASDVLLDTLLRTDSPSYGYQLAQGATALTEAWDANPKSSQDHLMLGDAEEWFYAGLGGIAIDLSRTGSDRIAIHPAMLARVASADIRYDSVVGEIQVAWKRDADKTMLDVTIPPNAAATVEFRPGENAAIRESGELASHARGVTFLKMDGASPVYRVESGVYHFSIAASRPR
jgi:alpha-L-rhamnosidase